MTEKELIQIGKKWQELLYLQDWDLKFEFQRFEDGQDYHGITHYQKELKTATIVILDPQFYKSSSLRPQNIEQTVIHELIHLHLLYWNTHDCTQQVLKEQTCELLARSFYRNIKK